MSVEFLEIEQIDGNVLPVEQVTTVSFSALHWALVTHRTLWVL